MADSGAYVHHGGRLGEAAARYGIPLTDWLDLSTGINPNGWPVPTLPARTWSRLPEDDDGLEMAARAYYGTDSLLPVAGSQAAIQALPHVLKGTSLCVGVLYPSYAEHAHAWQRNGHTVLPLTEEQLDAAVSQVDVLVLICPNNPTGARFDAERLLHWHASLAERGGWLVVDEAFMDATPEHSLAHYCSRPGLIVLRSLGKFFGLAGVRVGCILAGGDLLDRLRQVLGPWSIATPSRWVAQHALSDTAWQQATRAALPQAAARLARTLTDHGLEVAGGSALFQWVRTPCATMIHEALARQGILTRLFTSPHSLRFGLPGNEEAWARLETTLARTTQP